MAVTPISLFFYNLKHESETSHIGGGGYYLDLIWMFEQPSCSRNFNVDSNTRCWKWCMRADQFRHKKKKKKITQSQDNGI